MINIENMNKIYEEIIEGKGLTTKELNGYGFTSKDLTKLVNDGVLKRIKRGYYELVSVDDLYLYGKKLISLKQYSKADVCFQRCYELNSNHFSTNFRLFSKNISDKNYEFALKNLDVLLESQSSRYKADANFYLILLSIITEVPDEYKDMLANLTYDDIKVSFSDKRFEDIQLQNKIRLSAF